MTDMTRRQVLAAGSATVCALALPATLAVAAPTIPKAEMFFTVDEPWGAFVRGHVTPEQFKRAVVDLVEDDSDILDSSEDWLVEREYDEDADEFVCKVVAEPEHRYMRLTGEDHPELGPTWRTCNATDLGAIPITVAMY